MERNSYNERIISFYEDKLFNYNNLGNDYIVLNLNMRALKEIKEF